MRLEKNLLTLVNPERYSRFIAETKAIGFGDLTCSVAQISRAVTRHAAFTFASAFARSYDQWVGLGGETFGSTGFHRRRFANPAQCPPTPFGDGERVLKPVCGGRIMRHAPARPEQTQFPNTLTQIVNHALRDAATAPTVYDALDTLADALLRLAAIAEVRHA